MYWTDWLLAALAFAGAALLVAGLLAALVPLRLHVAWAAPPGSVSARLGPFRLLPRPPRPVAAGAPAPRETLRLTADLLPTLRPVWRYLRRRLVVRRLHLRAALGTGDAAETAILYGGAWALWGMLSALLAGTVVVAPGAARFDLHPDFHRPGWRVEGECIVAVRLGQVILAMLILGWTVLRRGQWRRLLGLGKGVGRVGRASDRGSDEDGDGEHQRDGGRQHRGR